MHQPQHDPGSPIVLASSSPRRRELLEQMGVVAIVTPANVDETPESDELPMEYVERLAREKALKVAESGVRGLVIGADTTISNDGLILGKPDSAIHAIETLTALSGREHLVHTGVAVAGNDMMESCVVTTRVEFMPMTLQDIENYVATDEPFGKAGAYAIQGIGAILVKKIEGSFSNVVGLPLAETAELMKRLGYCVLSQRYIGSKGS